MADLHAFAELKLETEKPATESDDRPAGLPVPAGPIEATEHDYDAMVELVERQLMVFLMISCDDRSVLLEDDPSECYQDEHKLLYFTQTSLLNSLNERGERYGGLEPGDKGLVLSVRMLRQILFQLGLAESVLNVPKVMGKAIRVWKTTRDSWRHSAGNIHLTAADQDLGGPSYLSDPEWVLYAEGYLQNTGKPYAMWESLRTGAVVWQETEDKKTPFQIRWAKANKAARLLPKDQYDAWLTQRGAGAALAELEGALNGFTALPAPDKP